MLKPAPMKHYLRTIRSLGFRAQDVLDGTGMDLSSLQDPKYEVNLAQYRRVFENMARLGGGLGLDMGLGLRLEDLGPLGYAAYFSPTARDSLEDYWPHFGEMFGLMGRPVFSSDSNCCEIVVPALTEPAYRFCVEEALTLLSNMGQKIVGKRPPFERIEFAFAEPEHRARYTELFQCPVYFDARRTRVLIDQRWLEKPMRTQDETLDQFYQQHLRHAHQQLERSAPVVSRIRDLLLRQHEVTWPSLPEVAQALDLSERTLSRMLQQSGVSYRKVLEEFRIQQAKELLKTQHLPAKAMAYELGFRDVNAFRRAFKHWTGQTLLEFQSAG